ncbi:hypothetical protein BK130_21600 [Viridibacillus sp. FSL H8-0123]|nr:hypothetical protein BK130_21600 [Viridibacillus sp. FSL H8-0123]
MSGKQQIGLGIVILLIIIAFILNVFFDFESKWINFFNLIVIVVWGISFFSRFNSSNKSK